MPVDIKSFCWNHADFEKDSRESSKTAVIQWLPHHQPFLSSKSHNNSLNDSIFSQKPIR